MKVANPERATCGRSLGPRGWWPPYWAVWMENTSITQKAKGARLTLCCSCLLTVFLCPRPCREGPIDTWGPIYPGSEQPPGVSVAGPVLGAEQDPRWTRPGESRCLFGTSGHLPGGGQGDSRAWRVKEGLGAPFPGSWGRVSTQCTLELRARPLHQPLCLSLLRSGTLPHDPHLVWTLAQARVRVLRWVLGVVGTSEAPHLDLPSRSCFFSLLQLGGAPFLVLLGDTLLPANRPRLSVCAEQTHMRGDWCSGSLLKVYAWAPGAVRRSG